jgi:hypothetical protein
MRHTSKLVGLGNSLIGGTMPCQFQRLCLFGLPLFGFFPASCDNQAVDVSTAGASSIASTTPSRSIGSAPKMEVADKPSVMPAFEVRAGHYPLRNPMASFVIWRSDGTIQIMDFVPNMLTVQKQRQGKLTEAESKTLLNQMCQTSFATALRENPSPSMAESDAFNLTVVVPAKEKQDSLPAGFRGGKLADAAPVLQKFLQELLAIARRQKSVTLEAAYVRSELVRTDIWPEIKADTRSKIFKIAGLSQAARGPVQTALNQPSHFVPVSRDIYDQLVAVGHEIYIDDGKNGHQVSLWRAVSDNKSTSP